MKIQQFIKSLNNTEIGKGGTHECYVRVSESVKNIRNIFDPSNYEPEFINLKNGGLLDGVHITIGREFRINGLGDFYRNNDVNAGDFIINLNTSNDRINFQKNSRGFEVLNMDRFTTLTSSNKFQKKVYFNGIFGLFMIEFKESARKRSDSPNETDFYSIFFNDQNIINDLGNKEYLELSGSILRKVVIWQEYSIQL